MLCLSDSLVTVSFYFLLSSSVELQTKSSCDKTELLLWTDLSSRAVLVKSRCRTPTRLAQREAVTVASTRPVKRTVCRPSGSEDRKQEATGTRLRTGRTGTNRLTCQRDTVSHKSNVCYLIVIVKSSALVSGSTFKSLSFNRATDNGAGPGVFSSHTNWCQHLARPSNTQVWLSGHVSYLSGPSISC